MAYKIKTIGLPRKNSEIYCKTEISIIEILLYVLFMYVYSRPQPACNLFVSLDESVQYFNLFQLFLS